MCYDISTLDKEKADLTKDKDNQMVISQIIRQYELVYIFKCMVFVFMDIVALKPINFSTMEQNINYIGSFTLLLSAIIDLVILSKTKEVKGAVDWILIAMVIGCGLSLGGMGLSVFEVIKSREVAVYASYIGGVLCCFSPILEAVFDTEVRLQQQKRIGVND